LSGCGPHGARAPLGHPPRDFTYAAALREFVNCDDDSTEVGAGGVAPFPDHSDYHYPHAITGCWPDGASMPGRTSPRSNCSGMSRRSAVPHDTPRRRFTLCPNWHRSSRNGGIM
jgi:hypothetical protein